MLLQPSPLLRRRGPLHRPTGGRPRAPPGNGRKIKIHFNFPQKKNNVSQASGDAYKSYGEQMRSELLSSRSSSLRRAGCRCAAQRGALPILSANTTDQGKRERFQRLDTESPFPKKQRNFPLPHSVPWARSRSRARSTPWAARSTGG